MTREGKRRTITKSMGKPTVVFLMHSGQARILPRLLTRTTVYSTTGKEKCYFTVRLGRGGTVLPFKCVGEKRGQTHVLTIPYTLLDQ